ncbi:hypothetical protein ACLM5H_06190 [Fredinandcohnia humi]
MENQSEYTKERVEKTKNLVQLLELLQELRKKYAPFLMIMKYYL